MKKPMKLLLTSGAILMAFLAPFAPQPLHLRAQERIGLTSATFVDAGVTNIKVVFLQCDWDNQNIIVGVRATDTNAVPLANRIRVDFTYSGSSASNLLKNINTNRFDTTSLHRKIIAKLQADGFLPSGGTFSGVPE